MAGDFSRDVKIKILLWSDRHCCLCGKACGSNIEVHHIVPPEQGGPNDMDNAIPLCFDCHSDVLAYNVRHPRGSKYRIKELKARREQIYERHTRHLVPPIGYQITQYLPNGKKRDFPDVGFTLSHLGDYLPVKVKTIVNILLGGKKLGPPDREYYAGNKYWRLNPRRKHHGHFKIPKRAEKSKKRLEVEVDVTIIDQYEKEHKLLPVGFVYVRKEDDKEDYWYFEP